MHVLYSQLQSTLGMLQHVAVEVGCRPGQMLVLMYALILHWPSVTILARLERLTMCRENTVLDSHASHRSLSQPYNSRFRAQYAAIKVWWALLLLIHALEDARSQRCTTGSVEGFEGTSKAQGLPNMVFIAYKSYSVRR